MMSSVGGKNPLINLALTDSPTNKFKGFSFIPKPVSIPKNKEVNANEVFHAGGIMLCPYRSGVRYK